MNRKNAFLQAFIIKIIIYSTLKANLRNYFTFFSEVILSNALVLICSNKQLNDFINVPKFYLTVKQ